MAVQSHGFVVRTLQVPIARMGRLGASTAMAEAVGGGTGVSATAPEDELKIPKRVQLIVEPTPFTHVSGYANRFKEYLKYQKKASPASHSCGHT